ncbi:hypothetical protein Fcan01_10184 [Folsomia candida]|uniref:Uncharacterized protein n=1 Tax=Folsomia candida TaxID=158441 RepID=A0A226EAK7_FOLCA|nr:hypothetical protein Fcan01_10184 [Folsomia candida]
MSLVELPGIPVESLVDVIKKFDIAISKGHDLFHETCRIVVQLRERQEDPRYQGYDEVIAKERKQLEEYKDILFAKLMNLESRKRDMLRRDFEDAVERIKVVEQPEV